VHMTGRHALFSRQPLSNDTAVWSGIHRDMKKSNAILNLDRFLPFRLTSLSNAITKGFAEAYVEYGLSTPEWRTVMLLAAFPGSSSDEVAARSNIEKSVVSRLIASLLHRGFIRRALDPDDRRRSSLTLSAKGKAVYDKIMPIANRFDARLRSRLSAEDNRALDRILREMTEAVRIYEGPPNRSRRIGRSRD
jgi:DNA-binding MarR family transcriptional regulator